MGINTYQPYWDPYPIRSESTPTPGGTPALAFGTPELPYTSSLDERIGLFSLGRERGSRFQLNCIQSAGTPLKNSLVYSPERRTGSCQVSKVSERDLQDQQCEY